jgi:hypothetical protein
MRDDPNVELKCQYNKRRGQVLYNEDHNQDSINEAPTADELVQSEKDDFLNELDDGRQSSKILNHKQQRRPDTGEILDAEGYTTQDDEEELLKLQSNMERKQHKKTKKLVSKSIKAKSTPIVSKEWQSNEKGNNDEALSSTKKVSNLLQNRKVVWMAAMSRAVHVMGLVAIYIYIYINLLQALPPNSKSASLCWLYLQLFFISR